MDLESQLLRNNHFLTVEGDVDFRKHNYKHQITNRDQGDKKSAHVNLQLMFIYVSFGWVSCSVLLS